jgi:hypothetical protein
LRRNAFLVRRCLATVRHGGCEGHEADAGCHGDTGRVHKEGVMAAKKIVAKSKAKASAKKGARKVSPSTPRGMARRVTLTPPSNG